LRASVLGARLERDDLSPAQVFLKRLQARLHEIPEEDRRLLVVIAGHNGAGKTTIYNERIAAALTGELEEHINPDEVERAITVDLGAGSHTKEEFEKLAAKEGSRLRLQYLGRQTSFSFETVFSDPVQDKVRFMAEARQRGYLVVLFAVGLDSIEKSKARVAIRHAKGGHTVHPEKLESRYGRVLENFAHGARAASLAIFFDNSEDRGEDGLDTFWDVAFFDNGELVVKDESPPAWWQQVENIFHPWDAGEM
jgi:predicted ABC-type ATPase